MTGEQETLDKKKPNLFFIVAPPFERREASRRPLEVYLSVYHLPSSVGKTDCPILCIWSLRVELT